MRDENGCIPLHIACNHGYRRKVQSLPEETAKVNSRTNNSINNCQTHFLKEHCSTDPLLQIQNADVTLCCNDGFSPLYIACEIGHDEIVQHLLENGADVNSCNKAGFSPLYIACQENKEKTVKLLLEKNADVNLCSND